MTARTQPPEYADDPAAAEIKAIRDQADALRAIADAWLTEREELRRAQAGMAADRERRVADELARAGRVRP